MPLRVVRKKQPGESRYIDYLDSFYCFKVSHTFNEELIYKFKKCFKQEDIFCVQPTENRQGAIGRRWWRVKLSSSNCVALLRWGIQSDYTFTKRALAKLNEIAIKLHDKKPAS